MCRTCYKFNDDTYALIILIISFTNVIVEFYNQIIILLVGKKINCIFFKTVPYSNKLNKYAVMIFQYYVHTFVLYNRQDLLD